MSFKEFKANFSCANENKQLAVLLNASLEDEFLGGLWIVRSSQTAHFCRFVVARDSIKSLGSFTIGPALWWEGIKWAKAVNCRWVDVEGYEQDVTPEHQRYNLYKLKSEFNPLQAHVLAPATSIIIPSLYKIQKFINKTEDVSVKSVGIGYKLKVKWNEYRYKSTKSQTNNDSQIQNKQTAQIIKSD